MTTQADVSRVMYMELKLNTGAPPVKRTKLSEDFSVFQIGDMEFEIMTSNYGNIWKAKAECVLRWNEANNPD